MLTMLFALIVFFKSGYYNSTFSSGSGGSLMFLTKNDLMLPAIQKGSLVISEKQSYDDIKVGDVICYYDSSSVSGYYIKRVISKNIESGEPQVFKIKSDNADDETEIAYDSVEGRIEKYSTELGKIAKVITGIPGLCIFIMIPLIMLLIYNRLRKLAYKNNSKIYLN